MPKTKMNRSLKSVAARAATIKPVQHPAANLKNTTEKNSKQARVIAMLCSPAGTTIAAMMKETDWQQHSVRGFLAGVIRKKLKLNVESEKIDGTRIYRIGVAGKSKTGGHQAKRRAA